MIPVKKGSLRLNYSHCIHDWPVMWGIRKSYFHWPLKTHRLLFSGLEGHRGHSSFFDYCNVLYVANYFLVFSVPAILVNSPSGPAKFSVIPYACQKSSGRRD